MKASNTEIYNAIEFGGTFFSEHQKEELTLAIQRAESDPMEIVSVGRLFIAMAKSEIERERERSSKFWKDAFATPRYDLTEKGNDHVHPTILDALRAVGAV
jgi:hypothetical protein